MPPPRGQARQPRVHAVEWKEPAPAGQGACQSSRAGAAGRRSGRRSQSRLRPVGDHRGGVRQGRGLRGERDDLPLVQPRRDGHALRQSRDPGRGLVTVALLGADLLAEGAVRDREASPGGPPAVPSTYSVHLVSIELQAGLLDDDRHDHPHPHRSLPRGPDPARPGAREPRAAASAGRPPAQHAAPPPATLRPAVLL
jgi:hypothetical protein